MSENFSFQGFDPTPELQSMAKEIFWRVEENSPSQAARTAFLKKGDNGYEGSIKICSLAGTFIAEAEAGDPNTLILDLYDKISQSLIMWKKNRTTV